jgi:hypothetical protein
MSKHSNGSKADHAPGIKQGDGQKENTNRHVYIEPGAQIDIVPELKKQHATERQEDKTSQDRQLRWTKIAAGLVLLYTFISGFQAYYTRRALEIDQRPWIAVNFGWPAKIENPQDIKGSIVVKTTGRTPAKRFASELRMEIVPRDRSPELILSDRLRSTSFSGILAPNEPDEITVAVTSGKEFVTPTAEDVQALRDGKTYLAIYGRSEFTDMFGNNHWINFCSWQWYSEKKALEFGAGSCVSYNDTDNK